MRAEQAEKNDLYHAPNGVWNNIARHFNVWYWIDLNPPAAQMEQSSIPEVKTSGYIIAPVKGAVGAKQDNKKAQTEVYVTEKAQTEVAGYHMAHVKGAAGVKQDNHSGWQLFESLNVDQYQHTLKYFLRKAYVTRLYSNI